MPDNTVCPYFEDGSVELVLPAPFKSRRVPTPVCGLAEIMLARLRKTAGGQEIANILTLTPATAAPRSMYGPDLEPPVRQACTLARLQPRCEAGFVQILTEQTLSSSLPPRPVALPETESP